MSELKLTISVVIYKSTLSELEPLFQSLCALRSTAICVVDNFGDAILKNEVLKNGWGYLSIGRNLGYGKGHNLAYSWLSGFGAEFHLVVNPDVSFLPSDIEKMLTYIGNNEDVGLLMPQVRFPDGHIQRLCKMLPTPVDLLARRFLPSMPCLNSMSSRYDLANWSYNEIADIPVLSGCFMLLRKKAFDGVGGFDPGYFMYLEDTDLCRRIGARWINCFYPEASITHAYAKGSYKSKKLLFFHVASSVRYFFKWGWFLDSYRKTRNARAKRELLL
ncbi:glycosyltransferase family 2 protein [Silvimonas soli]|uniref:glycosyltransferase family 2 protein n=1 Tax=Silvimonas soli TaxID=2980100 RepID=UPI0024B334C5|nr:glycosyltransferase family 2 protein [Silvimonas soli]